MKKTSESGAAKLERKTVEKNRRMHMKSLCFKLSSIIPKDYFNCPLSKDTMTQLDNIDHAASYIQNLKERIEKLKKRKELVKNINRINDDINNGMKMSYKMPVIEVRQVDSNLEVILISGLEKNFTFHEVIRILAEEGAEVVNASFSIVGDKIFHTIHSQPISTRTGLEVSRISGRLSELVQ